MEDISRQTVFEFIKNLDIKLSHFKCKKVTKKFMWLNLYRILSP